MGKIRKRGARGPLDVKNRKRLSHLKEIVGALCLSILLGAIGVLVVAANVGNDGQGVHATDSRGQPVGPFDSTQEAARANAWHAPKPSGGPIAPSSLSCHQSLGAAGPFQPGPGEFHYSDGVITGGYRAFGSDGRFYELFGGVRQPDATGTDPNLSGVGFILVREYASDQIDPCKALTVSGSDSPIFAATFSLPTPTGAVTLIGVTRDVVSYRTGQGQLGSFNFVTRTNL